MSVDTLVAEARERLVARAKREGLASVGYATFTTDLGPLWIAVGPRGVLTIHYGPEPGVSELARLVRAYGPGVVPDEKRVSPVASQVEQYLSRRRQRFDLDVDLRGLTPFQRRILRATARVPYGELTTYADVARRAGSGRATRAAGAALGANPVPIVVPCHRVVASDGSLGGYAGGLRTKRRLLALEREGDVPKGGWPPARR
ncbi:MAG TPA: methylated-DNA--[protein]-cysteine S-methyltransferase [Candidatus Limnocylindria bacterium]|nr:methylated-DNA--[protein]-cysteine S-methyltransferase [Candidatus Limnocylindria bacterium]